MFQFEHPDDYIERQADERARRDRRNELIRALRGAVPPFSEETERKLSASMRIPERRRIVAGEVR